MSNSLASPAKIFVLGNGSLLDEGISSILSLTPQFRVTRILYTDDITLFNLVNFEHPFAVFINEFDALDIGHVVRLIFSVPLAFVSSVIVAHIENSRFDVYMPARHAPVTTVRRKSIAVKTKEELINLVLKAPVLPSFHL
jgi:hypothetical protein